MNYIKELNAFRDFLFETKLPAGAISLWYALMSINNKAKWKRRFNVSNAIAGQLAGLSKQGVLDARNKLIEHALIHCEKGCKGKAPSYEMISLVDDDDATTSEPLPDEIDQSSTGNTPIAMAETRRNLENNVAETEIGAAHSESFKAIPENPMDEQMMKAKTMEFDKSLEEGLSPNRQPASRLDPLPYRLLDSSLDRLPDHHLPIHKRKHKQNKKRQDRSAYGKILMTYEENIGDLSPITKRELWQWHQKVGEGLLTEAINRTAKHNGKTFGYLEKILLEWQAANVRTIDDCLTYQKRKDSGWSKGTGSYKQQQQATSESLFDELRREAGL
ncbi:DnaD domain protein [Lentibacillus sp. N15]|uniref:DnaD domain protein n=1 Tax=Lentibacillus songyuanensis TaxID=3136161 RepID=UPI0031BB0E57